MQITIEKLVFGGQGLGRAPTGQVVFVWNALPGEVVEARIIKRQKTHWEAIAEQIITPSPARTIPTEEHYLICSPWQIMSPETENTWKMEMARETYEKIGNFVCTPDIATDEQGDGYRNKMEYSFALDAEGKTSFAFFERGAHRCQALKNCCLADPIINRVAEPILAWVNKYQIPLRSLRSLIVRSNSQGKTIAALFIKDELPFADFPTLSDELVGFQLYYSYYKTPAAVPTKLLYTIGENALHTNLNSVSLKFGLLSFFQIHVPVFEEALRDMGKFLDPTTEVVDFYGGVGSISLPLHKLTNGGVIVDNNAEAIAYATENIQANSIKNFTAECRPAEKITELITSDKTIILDPPRAGLHDDVTNALLKQLPKTILYLSCNLSTQARDIAKLLPFYDIVFSRLYNFFPRTPHVEGLIVLKKK
jgi:23S rRNA (uracil1939-C5)-methyltransferase